MLVSPESAAYVGTAAGFTFSLISYAIGYGVMRANVENLTKRQNDMDQQFDKLDEKFVPFRHFDAFSKQVEESLKRIEKNVGRITEHLLTESIERHSRERSVRREDTSD